MKAVAVPLLLALLAAAESLAAEETIDSLLEGFDTPADTEGEEASELGDLLQGFDEPVATSTESDTPSSRNALSLSGSAALGLAYTLGQPTVHGDSGPYDAHGLSRARAKINLELEKRLAGGWKARLAGNGSFNAAYALNGRDHYTPEFINVYESEVEIGEAWMSGSLHPRVDLKAGRQIVVWGRSDSLRVTDVINPMDNREPGMVDIEDLRLPVGMLKLDAYTGDWSLSAMAIPEVRLNKNPVYGSDYYPGLAPLADRTPDSGGNNTEYALALKGEFSGWDISLYRADYFDDSPYSANGSPVHARLKMLGTAANLVRGNWLLKAEFARIDGLRYATVSHDYQRRDLLLGAEYSGLHETTLALEALERRIIGYDAALVATTAREREHQLALRYTGEFLHDRLQLTGLLGLFGFGINDGGFARISANYELAEALGLNGGVISYWDGDNPARWGENDRLFMDLKYSF